jgi:hypothetical protein
MLAVDPRDCPAGQFATTIDAAGNLTCASVDLAAKATMLAADPKDCPAGQFATTIDAAGNLTCTPVGLATKATMLAATPTGCPGGKFATTIDAAGNLTCAPITASDVPAAVNSAIIGDGASEVTGLVAGTYVVMGKATLVADANDADCTCTLNGDADAVLDQTQTFVGGTHKAAMVLNGGGQISQGTVAIRCSCAGNGVVNIADTKITALQLGTVTVAKCGNTGAAEAAHLECSPPDVGVCKTCGAGCIACPTTTTITATTTSTTIGG